MTKPFEPRRSVRYYNSSKQIEPPVLISIMKLKRLREEQNRKNLSGISYNKKKRIKALLRVTL